MKGSSMKLNHVSTFSGKGQLVISALSSIRIAPYGSYLLIIFLYVDYLSFLVVRPMKGLQAASIMGKSFFKSG
jgi:hypothetical protein